MKYVIVGGAGHTSKPIAEALLQAGHDVTVIGRNAANLKPLTDAGAKAAIGSIEDMGFLKSAFTGADAVYTMVPPKMDAPDWKAYIAQIGKNYAGAIKAAGVKYVVNLSSVGAHLPEGCGPVSGLYHVEQALNALADVKVLHLRPAYFYYNFLNNAGMAKHMGIIGSNFGGDDRKQPLVHTADISRVAADALLHLNFNGHSIRYIVSDERTTAEIAQILGAAIGKPELPWVYFTDAQAVDGMKQAGLTEEVATNYAEMGASMQTGVMAEDYWKHHPAQLEPTKLEAFAPQFATAYQAA